MGQKHFASSKIRDVIYKKLWHWSVLYPYLHKSHLSFLKTRDAHESKMTRKFLFCFPLRLGNMVFGYIILIITLAVMAYSLYQLGMEINSPEKFDTTSRFKNWEKLEELFGEKTETLASVVTMVYYLSYAIVAFLMFLFSALFTCGAYSVNNCLVSSFFLYSFFHMFLTIFLIVWEATSGGWIQLGLIVASDDSGKGGIKINGESFHFIRFADDIAALAENSAQLEQLVTEMDNEMNETIKRLTSELNSTQNELENTILENNELHREIHKLNKEINILKTLCYSSPVKKNRKKGNHTKSLMLTTGFSTPPSKSPIVSNTDPHENLKVLGLHHKITALEKQIHDTARLENVRKEVQNELAKTQQVICNLNITMNNLEQILKSTESKSYTKQDYCIVMVGEEDFDETQNYKRLVDQIKKKLETITNTNIIIAAPTYICGAPLYNARVEIFNKLLNHDMWSCKYGYGLFFDSNEDLTLDVFSENTGKLGNAGIRNLIKNIAEYLEAHQSKSRSNDNDTSSDDINNIHNQPNCGQVIIDEDPDAVGEVHSDSNGLDAPAHANVTAAEIRKPTRTCSNTCLDNFAHNIKGCKGEVVEFGLSDHTAQILKCPMSSCVRQTKAKEEIKQQSMSEPQSYQYTLPVPSVGNQPLSKMVVIFAFLSCLVFVSAEHSGAYSSPQYAKKLYPRQGFDTNALLPHDKPPVPFEKSIDRFDSVSNDTTQYARASILNSAGSFLSGAGGQMVTNLAKDVIARSTGSSQVLSLNLTNLVILIVLKALILAAGFFGAGAWKGGHHYGRSLDDNMNVSYVTEDEILINSLELQSYEDISKGIKQAAAWGEEGMSCDARYQCGD
ncbi:hypothetical protein MSG28_004592 [Choristoneura fumiferana]|uniref:Uncharacterized protein n=1 Tax=Choristoneura fumiferana TaxID=7141 RepID=A0ACC0K6J1_CHOFU|nr:hypothetical protein MSG28_004592 [Choristoneura fumiferana]